MKNRIINLFIVLGGMLAITSCEDFLDTKNLSADNLEYLCSNPTDARKMVDHVYAFFCEDSYTSRMSNNWMQNTDVEFATVSKDQAIAHNDRRGLWALNAGSFSDILTCWNHNYQAIDFANQVIEGIEASEMYQQGDRTMQQLLGETYCLRAYRYFLLCNFWGDVPFALTPSKYGGNNNTPRMDKNIIYSQMIQDLVNVEEQMQWAQDISYGSERMNREFALGFIAKLALFRAGYSMQADGTMSRCRIDNEIEPVIYNDENGVEQTAVTSDDFYKVAQAYCRKLIKLKDRELPADFKNIFYTQINSASPANNDVLFEIGFVLGGRGDVAWCIGLSVQGGAKGAGSTYTYLTPAYACSFDKEDQRFPVTVSSYEYRDNTHQAALNGFTTNIAKWCRLDMKGYSADKGTGINWPVMRYPDVLLMLAEADNELNNGPTDEAKALLKRVRERAFVSSSHKTEKVYDYVNNLTGYADFKQAVINERAWEFGGECVRKFDLIRWNYYSKAIVNAIEWMRNAGINAQQLDVSGTELTYNKNKAIADIQVADRLYFKFVNGAFVAFENDIWTVRDASVEPYKSAETISNGDIVDNKYSAEKLYRVDFAKGFISVSDKDSNNQAYGIDGNGDAIKKGLVSDNIIYAWYGLTDGTLIKGMEDLTTLRNKVTPYVMPIPSDKVINSQGVLTNDGYAIRNK